MIELSKEIQDHIRNNTQDYFDSRPIERQTPPVWDAYQDGRTAEATHSAALVKALEDIKRIAGNIDPNDVDVTGQAVIAVMVIIQKALANYTK
jgi:hypothetical protein